jgi:8-oxo-dGTP pyrophosphatase MutT (NUDIX family)
LEALEEAGVRGQVAEETLGSFNYRKELKSGEIVICRVQVFALEVTEADEEWSEKADRETLWCSIEEALARVGDAGLRRLIAKFAQIASARLSTHILPASA